MRVDMEATTCVQFLIKKNQTSFILIWKVVKKIRIVLNMFLMQENVLRLTYE